MANQQALPLGAVKSQDIWQRALTSIDESLQSSLEFKHRSKQEVFGALLRTARRVQLSALQKRIKFNNQNGDIILRDVMDKMIVWIEQFKATDVLEYSLPWIGLRYLLEASLNQLHHFGWMLEHLETISYAIVVNSIIQESDIEIQPQNQLEGKFTQVYTDILVYLAKGKQYFEAEEKDLPTFQLSQGKLLESIISQQAEIGTLAQHENHILKNLGGTICRKIDPKFVFLKNLDKEKHQKILQWISETGTSLHQFSGERISGSGQWVLQNPVYLEWNRSSSSSILLLHGEQGSGKTYLASTIVGTQPSKQQVGAMAPEAPVAIYCCSLFGVESVSPDEILRNILKQLTVPDEAGTKMHERLLVEFERREAEAGFDKIQIPRLTTAQCIQPILDILGSNPATIVVDAMDELPDSIQQQLLLALTQIIQESSNVVKVLITSRRDIKLDQQLKIKISPDDTQDDMAVFIQNQASILTVDLSDHQVQNLLQAAQGRFLWVKLQLEKLARMTELELNMTIKSLPTLEDLIGNSIGILEAPQRLIFSLLLAAQERLSTAALLQAANFQQGANEPFTDLTKLCLGWIVLDSKNSRFLSRSIKEILAESSDFSLQKVHKVAATTCLNVLNSSGSFQSHPDFYQYAATYWPIHFRKSETTDSPELNQFVFSSAFTTWYDQFQRIAEAMPPYHTMKVAANAIGSNSPIFTASAFGLTDILANNSNDFDMNQVNGVGSTPIELAAAFGHNSVVEVLIKHANLNLIGQFGTPLEAACFAGHIDVIQTLLANGADLMSSGKFSNAFQASCAGKQEIAAMKVLEYGFEVLQENFQSLLQDAAKAGFTRVVWLLHETYGPEFGTESTQKSLLAISLAEGHFGIFSSLIASSQNPKQDIPTEALSIAALRGENKIISLLLSLGLDIDQPSQFGNPLMAGTLMGQEHTVRFLLDHGANSASLTNSEDLPNSSLIVAAIRGYASITMLLSRYPFDPKVCRPKHLYSGITAASYHGHKDVLEILLAIYPRKASVTPKTFRAAIRQGHDEIVPILAPMTRPERKYAGSTGCVFPPPKNLLRDTAKDLTTPETQKQIVERETFLVPELLYFFEKLRDMANLKVTANQVQQDRPPSLEFNQHPLKATGSSGNESILLFLLDNLVRLELQPKELANAFTSACIAGHGRIVRQLLDHWPRAYIKDPELGLIDASEAGREHITDMLLGELDISLKLLEDSMMRAASSGHIGILEKLLSHKDQSKDTKISIYNSILINPKAGEHVEIVRFCLKHLAQLDGTPELDQLLRNTIDKNFKTVLVFLLESFKFQSSLLSEALDSACQQGYTEMVQILLDSPQINTLQIQDYDKAFQNAVSMDRREIYNLLLQNKADKLIITSTTLVNAAAYGATNLVKQLAQTFEIDENYSDALNQALNVASGNGHKTTVELLLSIDANSTLNFEEHQEEQGMFPFWGPKIPKPPKPSGSALKAAIKGARRFNQNSDYLRFKSRKPWHNDDQKSYEDIMSLLIAKTALPTLFPDSEDHPLSIIIDSLSPRMTQQLLNRGLNTGAIRNDSTLAFRKATSRELYSADILRHLISAGAIDCIDNGGKIEALKNALGFFQDQGIANSRESDKILLHKSVRQLLESGPAASVKIMLEVLPLELAKDAEYGVILQYAAAGNDSEYVQLLIERQIDVNIIGWHYGTALQAAAFLGHAKIVLLLLKAGANVNIMAGHYGTALRAAVIAGQREIAHILLSNGADIYLNTPEDPDYIVSKDDYILTSAIKSKSLEIVQLILEAGADPNWEDEKHPHVLMEACEVGNLEIVDLLIKKGANVNLVGKRSPGWGSISSENGTPLLKAIHHGHIPIVELLLNCGADPEGEAETSGTPLWLAAHRGQIAAIRLLLEAGAVRNDRTMVADRAPVDSALYATIDYDYVEVVKEILAHGSHIITGSQLSQALRKACEFFRTEIISAILDYLSTKDLEDPKWSQGLVWASSELPDDVLLWLLDHGLPKSFVLLRRACWAGLEQSVKALIESGMDINGLGEDDTSLLQDAARNWRPEIIQILLDHGADVNHTNEKYGTPLDAALEAYATPDRGRYPNIRPRPILASAELLPKTKELTNSPRYTQINRGYAIFERCQRTVEILINSGGSVHTNSRSLGNTLHLVAFMGSKDVMQMLLDRGMDINSIGAQSENALYPALSAGHNGMVELLLSKGINVDYISESYGTALHYAHSRSNIGGIYLLIKYGANINITLEKHGNVLVNEFPKRVHPSLVSDVQLWDSLLSRKDSYISDEIITKCISLLCERDLNMLLEQPEHSITPSQSGWVSPRINRFRSKETRPFLQYDIDEVLIYVRRIQDLLDRRPDYEITSSIREIAKEKEPVLKLLAKHEQKSKMETF